MKLNPIKSEIFKLWSMGKSVAQIEKALDVSIAFGRNAGLSPHKELARGDYEVFSAGPVKIVERRTSERTGDAIWMMFECGAGSRWVSTTEDSTGKLCNFSGCNCGTRCRKMGETDDRGLNWFGLRVGKGEA
jgi:hypothetical protein